MTWGGGSWVRVTLSVVLLGIMLAQNGAMLLSNVSHSVSSADGESASNPTPHAKSTSAKCVTCNGIGLTQAGRLSVAVSAVPLTSQQDTQVNFTATASGGAPPYTYLWDFGDGAKSSASSSNVANHSYLGVGLYIAVVNVSDNSGDFAQGWVQVNTTPGFCCSLTAQAWASVYNGTSPLNVTFSGQAYNTSGTAATYTWTIGTPWIGTASLCGASDGQSINRTLVKAGLYEAALCVSTLFGGSQSAVVDVLVNPAIVTYPVNFTEGGLPNGTSWSMNLGGTTNTSTTATVGFTKSNGTYSFTVGPVAGYAANLSSGNVTVNGGPVSQLITFTPQPLYAVNVSPPSDTIEVGTSANFTATITCTGGTCTSGAKYVWRLNNTALGTLNTTGVGSPSVKFTAGTTTGAVKLLVNASLNGNFAVNSSAITIVPVPTLAYVSLTPLTTTVNTSWTRAFNAIVGCHGGTCPAGATYTWSMNNSLGKLNASSGPQVLFTANSTVGLVNLTVTAHLNGKTVANSSAITITKSSSPPSTYTVTFTESSLPSGTGWSVTFNGTPSTSSASNIVFSNLLNNTAGYSFTVGTVTGYTSSPSSGTVVVNGANVTRSILFTKSSGPTQYTVTFTESGLPSGTSWSVILNGTTRTSTTTTLTFNEPNGTYSYTIVNGSGYSSNPSSGSITVNARPAGASIAFTAIPAGSYSVTFSETGLPTAANWSVSLAGKTTSATNSTISFTERNGTYNYGVTAPTGYSASPSSGLLTVAGKAISQSLTFTKIQPPPVYGKYTVTFTENGLASGTSWSVTLNGSTQSSTAATITFSEVNGGYSFTVGSVSGYSVNPTTGTVRVDGSSTGQAVTFTSSAPSNSKSTGFLGLPGDDGYIVIGVVAAAAVVAALLLRKHRRGKAPQGDISKIDGVKMVVDPIELKT